MLAADGHGMIRSDASGKGSADDSTLVELLGPEHQVAGDRADSV